MSAPKHPWSLSPHPKNCILAKVDLQHCDGSFYNVVEPSEITHFKQL